jgi:hypothetical protein
MAEKFDDKDHPKSPSIQESFAHDETAGDIYHGEHKLVRQLKNRAWVHKVCRKKKTRPLIFLKAISQ